MRSRVVTVRVVLGEVTWDVWAWTGVEIPYQDDILLVDRLEGQLQSSKGFHAGGEWDLPLRRNMDGNYNDMV